MPRLLSLTMGTLDDLVLFFSFRLFIGLPAVKLACQLILLFPFCAQESNKCFLFVERGLPLE